MSTANMQIDSSPLDENTPAAELIARYRMGPALLRASVAGLSAEQLLAYPVPGKMSVQEVVCHTADAEQFLADRMKRAIGLERPLVAGADMMDYVTALSYAKRDLGLDFALVDATRAQMASDLERIAEETWERDAVHTEVGLVTVRQIMLHTIEHLEWHVITIDDKREAMGLERSAS